MPILSAATVFSAMSVSDTHHPMISCENASVSRCRYTTPSWVSMYVMSATHSWLTPVGLIPLARFPYLRNMWLEFVVWRLLGGLSMRPCSCITR